MKSALSQLRIADMNEGESIYDAPNLVARLSSHKMDCPPVIGVANALFTITRNLPVR